MTRDPEQMLCAVAFAAALVLAAVAFASNQDFYSDDAFIGLRYAENAATGHGLVWNAGERVEGYTNALYTMLEAALGAVGVDLVVASRVINVIAFAALVLFLWARGPRLGTRAVLGDACSTASLVLVLASFPLIAWTLGGLEGPLFTAFATAGLWLLTEGLPREASSRRVVGSGALLGLACVTRLDGLLLVLLVLVFLGLEPRRERLGLLVRFGVGFLVVFAPYYVWRLLYYDAILPNTFWAKTAGSTWSRLKPGVRYVLSHALAPPYLVPLAALAVGTSIARRVFDRRMLFLSGVVVVHLAYVAYVGGDHMEAFRLVLPVIPPAALLIGVALTRLTPAPGFGRPARQVVLVSVLGLAALQFFHPVANPRYRDSAAFVGTILGKHIAATWPAGSLVALHTAGSTAFYARDLRFIDMLGLNDAHIARRRVTTIELPWQTVPGHLKGDGAYVLSRRPDYVILGPAEGTTIETPWFLSDLELSRDARFFDGYELRVELLDVRQIGGFERHRATRKGTLIFTYYARREGNDEAPGGVRNVLGCPVPEGC